jgi:hypothetical protein
MEINCKWRWSGSFRFIICSFMSWKISLHFAWICVCIIQPFQSFSLSCNSFILKFTSFTIIIDTKIWTNSRVFSFCFFLSIFLLFLSLFFFFSFFFFVFFYFILNTNEWKWLDWIFGYRHTDPMIVFKSINKKKNHFKKHNLSPGFSLQFFLFNFTLLFFFFTLMFLFCFISPFSFFFCFTPLFFLLLFSQQWLQVTF